MSCYSYVPTESASPNAWDELFRILNRQKWQGQGPEPSEDEVMEMVVKEIKALRRERTTLSH